MKSKEGGIVNGGSGYFLAGIYRPIAGKPMSGIDRVAGMFSSSDFFPPSGKGSEMAILSLLNWYRNKLSLFREKNKLFQFQNLNLNKLYMDREPGTTSVAEKYSLWPATHESK